MATFFSDVKVGFWVNVDLRGSLYGDVRRSGNTVYLENMTFDMWPVGSAWGTDTFTLTVNGTSTSWSVSGGSLSGAGVNSTSFGVGTTQTSANVGWSTSDGESGSFTVSFPSGATPPTGLNYSDLVAGVDSFSATVSITGWGDGATSGRYRELQVWTYTSSGLSEPRRWQHQTGNALSGTITVDNNSQTSDTPLTITPNTRYVIGLYATNGAAATGSQRKTDAYTLPPTPTSVTETGTQTYNTFDTINVPITVNIPSDGGALSKTIQYRAKKDSGEWGDWITFGTYNRSAAGSIRKTIVLDSSSTYLLEFRSSTTAGISPDVVSTEVTTLPTHEAPTFTNFDYEDVNPDTIAITGNNQYLVQGKSILRGEVKVQDKAEPSDPNFPITSYIFNFGGSSVTEPYSSSETVYTDLANPQSSGTFTVSAVDTLGATTSVEKNVTVLPYAEPTLTATANRISEDGDVELSVAGRYSPLSISGVAKNPLTVSYRLSDQDGVVQDWTTITITLDGADYGGVVADIPTTYDETYLLEVRTVDAFSTVETAITLSAYNRQQALNPPQYSIEVWTRDGDFLADISKYLTTDLDITWTLNDIEDLNFTMSLDALELLRASGVSVVELLTPYAHDVRVRRNGKYIVGCQVVEANIKIDNDQIPTVSIKATGFLNIFKDQYISEPMAGYTYPEMAHKLIYRAQHADCIIKNPTGDIDASYWLSAAGTIAQTTIAYEGAGAIRCYASSGDWTVMGTQMSVKAGTPIKIDLWVQGKVGYRVYLRERDLMNNAGTQKEIFWEVIPSGTTGFYHLTGTYTTFYDNGYIIIEQNQAGTPLIVDNVFIHRADDDDTLNNHYVGNIYEGGGHNYADTGYTDSREYNYELQNVKDAIMDLVNMGEDLFDFEFTPDRIFNTYARKGSDRTDIEIMYPGNVHSMTIDRSAADMANKVQEIGSGIGDERLETTVSDMDSREIYGTRESIVTANNVSIMETLEGLAQGELDIRSKMKPVISVTIQDGSINSGNIQTGDVLAVKIGNYLGVLGEQQVPPTITPMELLGGVEGWYKVKKLNSKISQDGVESVSLQLEFEEGFQYGES